MARGRKFVPSSDNDGIWVRFFFTLQYLKFDRFKNGIVPLWDNLLL